MESPLSFDSSENFRKKLLVRNLKPYNVNQSFTSTDIPGISDITLIDYSVIDSPSIDVISQTQEEILYNKNQYGPTNGDEVYGNIVNINLNLNTQTNQGVYDFSKSIGSKLELQGENQETLLYVNNLYGPQNQTSYGDTVNINQNFQTNTNIGEYDITDTIGSRLELAGNQQEVILYTNNLYGPQGTNSYGNTVDINQNLQSTSNVGEYDVSDSIGSKLETIGNFQEVILYTNNTYGPANSTSYGDTVNINQNSQSTSNNGEYGPIIWSLQRSTEQSRNIFYVLNEYGPDGSNGYGDQINGILDSNLQTSSNQGEYGPLTLTVTKTADQSRNDMYVVNEFGPEDDNGYGNQINATIYTDLISNSNQGEYGPLTMTVTKTNDQIRNELYVANEYGPESDNGYGNEINTIINSNLQTTSNQGQYDYALSPPSLSSQQSQNEAYGDNKYVNGDGNYEEVTITDVTSLIERTFLPYADSNTTFIFVPSQYAPYDILLQNDPQGSDGTLANDSSLAQLGAEKLQTEFKARVALELLQQTLSRVNAFNTSINTDTGNISAKPNTDPFNAIGIISGNIPLLARDYSVTSPDLLLGQGINFAAKLAGLYSPYSYIPGEYFDYPKKRLVNQLLENPIAAVVGSALGTINKITSLNIESGSELFLANTSNATSDLLFQQLSYNSYRPDYRLNSLRDPNLLAPKPSFYVGDRKTFLKSITPIDQQPLNRYGDNTEAAVFGHGGLGADYETYKGQSVGERFFFGLTTRGYYDGANNPNGTDTGTIFGGFTWGSSNSGTINKKIGYNNEVFGETDQGPAFNLGLQSTLAGDFNSFRPDSILDVTNQLVLKGEQAKGIFKQRHVGNAISQVSKVFNDGNIELTKGSRVIRYTTPNSVGSTDQNGVVGYEYCRVFTKDNPYYLYSDLQKTDGNIRKFQNSVLSNTYNLNIAPMKGNDSTSLDETNKRVKKYMFSLENLAWRSSNRPGFTVEDLPACEIGPNGGRIMWFPPYDLKFDESVKTQWTDHTFLGRTEPVYTYSNTSRSGSLSWKILVDHPSTLNLIVNKELAKTSPESKLTKIVDSFFAGCLKYDIYELLKKYAQFSISDVYDVILSTKNTDTFNQAISELPPTNTTQTSSSSVGGGGTTKDFGEYINKVALYFEDSVPGGEDNTEYNTLYNTYLNVIDGDYPFKAKNIIVNYDNENYQDDTTADKGDVDFFVNYIDATKNGISDFKSFIVSNYDKFNELKINIKEFLSQGNSELTLELTGGASATGSKSANKTLGKRRVESIKKWLETDVDLKKYINDKKILKIVDKSAGDAITLNVSEKNYNKIDCDKQFKGNNANEQTGIYSVNAMACRTVQVTNIVIKEIEKPNSNSTNTTQTDTSSVAPSPNAAEENAPVTQTPTATNGQPQSSSSTSRPQPRQDIVKRLLRKLLTESDYFEMIKENEPMIYDGIKQKIRHFDPAFHSITPEGLNSRLTFLQQCMRPGDTIPAVQKNNNQTTLVYGDAFNTAFGAPPVCVLRIGDFFHTKVIIDSLTLKYDEVPFDLNPEGIGVQPMIADVSLNFNFIGGQGLKQPIEQLQNALSFNYYANTEVYDERAEETEPVDKKLTAELIDIAQDSLGILTDLTRPDENNGQTTIGAILTQVVDPTGNTITGDIEYKTVFNELVGNVEQYFNSTFDALKKVNEDFLYGGIVLSSADVKYREGEIITTGSTNGRIFGYPVGIQQKVDDLFTKTKEDVDNDKCPLLYGVFDQNFKNADIRDVKKKIKEMIDNRKDGYTLNIKKSYEQSLNSELKLVNLIDKLNFVSGARDGYKNKKNTPIIYELSGQTTGVVDGSYANTFDEYKGDYAKIANDIQTFYDGMFVIIPPDGVTAYNEDYTFDLYLNIQDENYLPSENRFFMIFGKEIVDDPTKISGELYDAVTSSDDRAKWLDYFYYVIIGTSSLELIGLPSIQARYIESKNTVNQFFGIVENSDFYKKVKTNYQSDLKNKERKVSYKKQEPLNQTDGNKLLKLWQSTSIPDDEFNFKKEFRG